MTNQEIIMFQQREKAFAATPIGRAFLRFKNAHARAWAQDTEDSFTDKNRKSTKEAWEVANQAERDLRRLLENRE
jgi:hypothetical protein